MNTFHLKIVTPEKEVFDERVQSVYLPTPDGEIGILPQHASLMTKIVPGELRIRIQGKDSFFAMGEGFAEIKNDVLTILADLAIDEKEIDEKIAEDAKKRAEAALESKLSDEEYAETIAILEKSLAQLHIKRRHKVR